MAKKQQLIGPRRVLTPVSGTLAYIFFFFFRFVLLRFCLDAPERSSNSPLSSHVDSSSISRGRVFTMVAETGHSPLCLSDAATPTGRLSRTNGSTPRWLHPRARTRYLKLILATYIGNRRTGTYI